MLSISLRCEKYFATFSPIGFVGDRTLTAINVLITHACR